MMNKYRKVCKPIGIRDISYRCELKHYYFRSRGQFVYIIVH